MKLLRTRYARIVLGVVVAFLLLAAIGGNVASASGPTFHTVQRGETLFSIANHFGVNVWALSCANGIWNPNFIQAGMVLTIPSNWTGMSCKTVFVPEQINIVIKPGTFVIPSKFGGLFPGRDLDDKDRDHKGMGCFHRVQRGETLFSLAVRFHTTVWALSFENHLENPNWIWAGMVLRVPCN